MDWSRKHVSELVSMCKQCAEGIASRPAAKTKLCISIGGTMQQILFRSDGYSFGAHKVEASLDVAETKAYATWPISFHLLELQKRLIHTPLNFVVATSTESGTELRGIFVDGR